MSPINCFYSLSKPGVLLLSTYLCLGAPQALAAEKMPSTKAPVQATQKAEKTLKQTVKTQMEKLNIMHPQASGTAQSAEQAAQISQWANGAVEKIQAAQTSIDHDQLPEAKHQLGEAQSMLDHIQQSEPTGKAIQKAESTRQQVEQGKISSETDLVPLEQEIVTVETVTPVPKAKEHLKKAKDSLQQKNKAQAKQHLVDVESQLIYAEANLPVSRTKQDVLGAQTLLEQGKPKEAQKLLTDSLRHIQVLASETEKSKRMKLPEAVPAP